jgi:site-specific recombinase XerD
MNCLTQGVPITVVKELLGHASISSTMVYLKTDPAQAREFLSKVQF